MDKNRESNDSDDEKERMVMSFIPDHEVTSYSLLSEEQRLSIFKRMADLNREVKAGRIALDEAAAILMKPPFNVPNIYRARRILNPGPPTP